VSINPVSLLFGSISFARNQRCTRAQGVWGQKRYPARILSSIARHFHANFNLVALVFYLAAFSDLRVRRPSKFHIYVTAPRMNA
jgi:hypothetical protein